MFYILSLFWLLSISGLLTIVFNRKFEMVLTLSMILGTLMLYPFGYINHISYGYYLSWLFVLLFYVLLIYLFVKKKNDKLLELKNNYFTYGLLYFIIFSIYSFFLYKYTGFGNCDEFTHWGPMLKETLRLDGFYTQDASRLIMHKDYPPFFTLLEVLFQGFNGFKFHEPFAYIALETFMFSMLLPVFSNLKKKDWLKSLLIFISIVFVGLTLDKTETASDYAFVYNSIYVDWCLALFCTYGIYLTYKEEGWGLFRFIYLTLICVTFILMKQMGLVFYLIILIYAFFKVTFIDKQLDLKMILKGFFFLVVIPALFYISWSYVVKLYQIDAQFKIGELSIKDCINIIKGNAPEGLEWKYTAFRNYCSNLLHRPLVLHPFRMSYFEYVGLMMIIIFIALRFKKGGYFLAGTYLIGAIGYSIAMMILYTLAFTVDEAPYLASFDRYMASYLYFGTTLTLMLVIDKFNNYIYQNMIILGLLCLFVEPKTLNHLEIKTGVVDEDRMTIACIEQFNFGVDFNRENLNGFRLKFDRLGFLDGGEEAYLKLVDALNRDDGLFIIGYDDYIYEYWKRMGIEDYIFNEQYYKLDKESGDLKVSWDAYSFVHYVILYYMLGV